jgi:hypothetical protein
MIPPHMIPTFALVGFFIIFMLTLSAVLVAVATNEDVQKALEELENEENNDPSSSPSPSSSSPPGPPAFRYSIGTTVMCTENDPHGKNEENRYRVSSNQGKLRHYPDNDIAKAWDADDWEDEDYIEDCDGLALGDPMPEKPAVGASVRCGKNDLKGSNNISVYRVNADATLGHYPNPTIAASWDSGWDTPPKTTIGDCEGIIFGGDLQSNAAATNTPPSSSPPAGPSSLTWTTHAGKTYHYSVHDQVNAETGVDTTVGSDAQIYPANGIDGCKAKCEEFDSCKSIVHWDSDVCYLWRTNTTYSDTSTDARATIVENDR